MADVSKCAAQHEAAPEIWWLYLVETVHGHLYTGVTLDVARRFAEHCAGAPRGARSLRGKGPLTLRFSCAVGTKRQALQLEYAVKQLEKSRKQSLIAGEWRLSELTPFS